MTMRPVAALAVARLRRRGLTSAIAIAAVAGATALVAIVSGIGLIGADATLARAFPATGPERPVVRISHFSLSPRDIDATMGTLDRAVSTTDPGFLEAPVRGVLTPELRDLADPEVVDLVVAVDDPAAWLTIVDGRAPVPCLDGAACEAILLSEDPAPAGFDVAHPAPDLALRIVGRGRLDGAIPFDDLDQRGPFGDRRSGGEYQTERASPAVLLVDGVDALSRSPALDSTGRTYVWTLPLDPTTLHPWTAAAFEDVRRHADPRPPRRRRRVLGDESARHRQDRPGPRRCGRRAASSSSRRWGSPSSSRSRCSSPRSSATISAASSTA